MPVKNSQTKGFAPIIILLLVVAIGVVGYVLIPKPGGIEYIKRQLTWPRPTPTPIPPPSCFYEQVMCVTAPCPPVLRCPAKESSTETATWKTYTNTKIGFSFKYPKEWVYEDSSDLGLGVATEERKSGYQLLLGNPNRTTSAGPGKTVIAGSVSVTVYNKENYAYYKEDLSYYTDGSNKKTSKKDSNINGLIVEEIHHQNCPTNDDCISVGFKNDGNVFIFDTWVWNQRYKDLDTIYKILSTLKFTN